MNTFEIEIKSLLGVKENADALLERMKTLDSNLVAHGTHTQLNHYFINGNLALLYEKLSPYLPEERRQEFKTLTEQAKDYSIRSRLADKRLIFVMKASIDDTSSSNGTARLEFECDIALSLDELDKILLEAGFEYQAKWSRERQAFDYKGLAVTIDKNAGYGYLAEFESVTTDNTDAEAIKTKIREVMKELDVEELNQERLARMFDFYNTHWQDYYGTDNVFTIE